MRTEGAGHDKVLVIVGTRPEAIKMIPVIRTLQHHPDLTPVVIATGQHDDMVNALFASESIICDVDLRVNAAGPSSLNQLFAKVMMGMDVLWNSAQVPPALTATGSRQPSGAVAALVHGDTTSAVAAAMAAFHVQLPVVHVEAGLRTSNVLSPFPEEGNRQVISRLAALHCAPTSANKANLVREGVDFDRIIVTGNTSIDMLRMSAARRAPYGPGLADLDHDHHRRVVLVTAHRRESWGPGLDRIAQAVATLAARYPETLFVLPLHPNPVARQPFFARLQHAANVRLIEPMAYEAFARLMARATLAITDSGGVQEEAPALGTPVLVIRDTTERTEGIAAGTLELVGTSPLAIEQAAGALLDDPVEYARRASLPNPYGDGHAAQRIVAAISHVFHGGTPPQPFGDNELRTSVLRRLGRTLDCPADDVPDEDTIIGRIRQ